jgi:hypothetical protein
MARRAFQRRLSSWGRIMAAAAAVLLALAIGAGVRAVNSDYEPPYNPFDSSGVLTVGVLVDEHAGGSREMLRGLEIWQDEERRRGGIPVPFRDSIGVKVYVEDAGRTGASARAGVRRAVSKGATVIVGPPERDPLIAVARQAAASRVLLIAPTPRPLDLAATRSQTFLAWPEPGDVTTALDAVDRLADSAPRRDRRRGRGSRGRIGVLYVPGYWGRQAERAIELAEARNYTVREAAVDATSASAAIRRVDRSPTVVVFAFGSLRQSLRWFRSASRTGARWILSADDLSTAVPEVGGTRAALSVPWAFTRDTGSELFGPGEFTRKFRLAHNRLPRTGAAAGAAVGLAISRLVGTARSTDPTRLLRARDDLNEPSLWGRLIFEDGMQRDEPGALVLVDAGRIRQIAPQPFDFRLLRASVPPR